MSNDKCTRPTPRDVFSEYLEKHRRRRTLERFAILDNVIDNHDHFTIDELHHQLELKGFHVSKATVYSTLELLVDCGLARCHRFGSDSARYERAVGAANHHHLVCTRCGKIKEIRDNLLTEGISSIRYASFTASYFSLNIYGICRSCQKKERRKASSADNPEFESKRISTISNRKK